MSREPIAPPDPEQFMAEVARAWTPQNYTPDQRYADFRAVLFGSERGKRVLYQILTWGHLWKSSFVKGDPMETAFQEGERNLGLRIFAALNNEPPKSRPTKATSVKPKGD